MKQILCRFTIGCSLALAAMEGTASATTPPAATASVVLNSAPQSGGVIPQRFLGISLEWTLVESYMNPNAQLTFVNLLDNLGSGFIRVGGGSQDTTPYSANAGVSNTMITNADFALIKATLDNLNKRPRFDSAPQWGVVLGSAMTPSSNSAITQSFVQGVSTVFAGDEDKVAGISLGNEPDQDGYGSTFNPQYLTDFTAYSNPAVSGNWPIVVPSTSTDIVSWQTLANQAVPSRWFWSWPQILNAVAPTVTARAGVFAPWVSDHFYPFARNCSVQQPWRCATIPLLLGSDHMNSLDFLAYTHATMAAGYGLPYRLEETNTAARQGVTGVSDVEASAIWALDEMFHLACPQPPNLPGANANCTIGGVGVNYHNAEANGNTNPSAGNAYYNIIRFDPSAAMGPPVPAPEYYGALLFAGFAQGTSGLRPVTVSGADAANIEAWQVQAGPNEYRLFLMNNTINSITTSVGFDASSVLVDRLSPFDPTGTGLNLTAASAMIDGRQVAADGTWPGFAPTIQSVQGGQTNITLGPGEAVVLSGPVVVPPSLVLTQSVVKNASGFQATVTLTNNSTGAASNVQLTTAKLGTAAGSPLPNNLGTIAGGGASANAVITFPASAGTSGSAVVARCSGTYNGGSFTSSLRVVLP